MENKNDKSKSLKLNLGCGRDLRRGFLNCDIQKYHGVDKVMDCADLSVFKEDSVDLIFSHAFFEHLYLNQQIFFADHCFRVLKDGGILILLGIPDFEEIARCYLEKRPVLNSANGIFDIYQAYRLTHGDFEDGETVSIPQMHKAIFDKRGLGLFFAQSQFKYSKVFGYRFCNEKDPLALGVVARKNLDFKPNELKTVLAPFSSFFDNLDSEPL